MCSPRRSTRIAARSTASIPTRSVRSSVGAWAATAHVLLPLSSGRWPTHRERILHLLAVSDRELCVCDMALVLGMSVSALSHQLRFLRERGAVSRNKVGRIAYYRLIDDHLRRLILDAAVHVAEGRA